VYVYNNPLKYIDPSGNQSTALIWGGSAWGLTLIDGPLPIGDLIYIGGIFVGAVADILMVGGNQLIAVLDSSDTVIANPADEVGPITFAPPISTPANPNDPNDNKPKDDRKKNDQMNKVPKYNLNPQWKDWPSYMLKRGWSSADIERAVAVIHGERSVYEGTNYLNLGNPMEIIKDIATGKSLIIDKITGEIIQLGGVGFKF
jgi:hypothetical protein